MIDPIALRVETLAQKLSIQNLQYTPDAPLAEVPVQEMEPSPTLQIIGKMKDTLMGRAIGILIADGSDGGVIKKTTKALLLPRPRPANGTGKSPLAHWPNSSAEL